MTAKQKIDELISRYEALAGFEDARREIHQFSDPKTSQRCFGKSAAYGGFVIELKELDRIISENKQPSQKPVENENLQSLVKKYRDFGYVVQPGSKFWKFRSPYPCEEGYGLQVGNYEHSCHVDSTEYIVLLIIGDDGKHYVESFAADTWISNCIVVPCP